MQYCNNTRVDGKDAPLHCAHLLICMYKLLINIVSCFLH